MYKTVYVADKDLASLESILNDAANDGYRWVDMIRNNGHIIVVMEQAMPSSFVAQAKRGRPKKEESEGKLGE